MPNSSKKIERLTKKLKKFESLSPDDAGKVIAGKYNNITWKALRMCLFESNCNTYQYLNTCK